MAPFFNSDSLQSPIGIALLTAAGATLAAGIGMYRKYYGRHDYLTHLDPRIPRISGVDSYLGHLPQFNPVQFYRFYKDAVLTYGSPVASSMFGAAYLYFGTPEDAQQILTLPATRDKSVRNYKHLGGFLGHESVLVLPYARWAPVRRNLATVFHLQNMKGFFGVFVDASRDLVERITAVNDAKEKALEDARARGSLGKPASRLQTIDIDDFAMDLALDIVTRALFSRDLAIQKRNESKISEKLDRLTHYYMKVFANPLFWLMHPFQYREYHRLLSWFHNMMKGWLDERKADTSGNANDKDLLGLMLKNTDPETGVGFTDGEVISQCKTFYFAGHETTARTIAWAVYEISRHPEVEEKIHEELARVLGDKDAPTFEEASKLTYLQWVAKETLRLHPPVGAIMRTTGAATSIGGVEVPEGTNTGVSILAVHNSEETWPEPWRFRPERFSDEESAGRSTYSFLPFSGGERNCIGMQFALLEIRTVLAVLCTKFLLRPSVDLLPYTRSALTIIPVEGIHTYFIKRQ